MNARTSTAMIVSSISQRRSLCPCQPLTLAFTPSRLASAPIAPPTAYQSKKNRNTNSRTAPIAAIRSPPRTSRKSKPIAHLAELGIHPAATSAAIVTDATCSGGVAPALLLVVLDQLLEAVDLAVRVACVDRALVAPA